MKLLPILILLLAVGCCPSRQTIIEDRTLTVHPQPINVDSLNAELIGQVIPPQDEPPVAPIHEIPLAIFPHENTPQRPVTYAGKTVTDKGDSVSVTFRLPQRLFTVRVIPHPVTATYRDTTVYTPPDTEKHTWWDFVKAGIYGGLITAFLGLIAFALLKLGILKLPV